ncbi:undecaprenyldiphospho-muramoylpentapeptide beta-N-acetylglucosaminyltransferase [Thermocrinis minervae]|uniref:UDP-N-acetylglucosamine--N-acetylmuramyl-(pentapeptide) pyrophosphoryl-undecaprenol N-acetylglucosamine transferase n=1 Tax=Thermocrinis minervae TaxID=381751 RepID=A0A1M6PYW4_9AQUI|nr:undecaprenyldiphospho-muramoylpentapeptide beta-N-acetylglucosaminyltransferase [Thermocrinis minervae]SHK13130.1 UDP-N-acetylglucosamine-N-acetylmuramylpentapeptide N-acetylglucosamine transferase [Thermocrinis minervae]
MKLYVSGGGTGGHFFPALALMEEAIKKKHNVFYVGAKRGIENKMQHLINCQRLFLDVYPFVGLNPLQKIKSLFYLSKALMDTFKFVKGPAKALVFGGYASLPLGLTSILKKMPLFLHEQNSVPSKTNQLLSRFAKKIFITFEHSRKFFPKDRVERTGLPIRESLLKSLNMSRDEALKKLGLNEEYPVLLVMGGSQGSSFLNEVAAEVFLKTGWQGIHITGYRDYQRIKDLYSEKKLRVLVFPFYEDMGLLYRACSVALSRSGAGSVCELSLFGVPSLFIPYPHAAMDHQYYNAKELEELGGAFVLREEKAKPKDVIQMLEKLLIDRESFSERMKTFCKPDASIRILDRLEES